MQVYEAGSRSDAPLPQQARLAQRYGPWAVVTGASSGIGRALASEIAAAGIHVMLVARREGALQQVAHELERTFAVQTRVLPVDLSTLQDTERVSSHAADLDVGLLVCAAGYGSAGPFHQADRAAMLGMVDVNCRALTSLSFDFARRFASRRRGGIVLLSSIVAFQGAPYSATYAASKAFVQSLGEALHAELTPLGVDVLCSAPGPVHTEFAARAGMRMNGADTPENVARRTLAALGRRSTVRPGLRAAALSTALATLPRFARTRVMSSIMRGMVHVDPR